jgi:hypothetical protein
MAEELRVPAPSATPTYFNRSMAAGLGIGFVVGGAGLIIPVIGALVGGYLGKKDMEQEQKEGRVVSAPGLLKKESIKDGMIGLGIGSLVGGVIALGILALALPAAAGGISAAATVAAAEGLFVPLIAAAVSGITAMAAGGLLGLSHGKNRMEYEWKAAKDYVAANGEYKGKDQSPSIMQAVSQERYKDTVTPDEYRAMQEKMAAGKLRSENPALQAGR